MIEMIRGGENMAKYTIKFMPEYYETSLWPVSDNAYDDFGIPIQYEDVPLTNALVERLEKFDCSILGLIDWGNPGGACPLSAEERKAIYNEGQALLQLVKEELGGEYEVIDGLDWVK
ncbi:MAG: hypothetical protein J1E62_09175 [Lachnospiraceae bacterium]|nr:hypothetical protein [Lachnospiraceae bacterium]